MSAPPDDITDLFESYARALDSFDEEALAEHFAVPCVLASEAGTRVCGAPADLASGVSELVARHRRGDFHRVDHRVVRQRPMHARFRSVDVAWLIRRVDDSVLMHYGVTYTLTLTDEGWKIAATTPNEKLVAN